MPVTVSGFPLRVVDEGPGTRQPLRSILWIRRKHPGLGWKQVRRRYYGADRICEDGTTLYNPATMRVERYRFRGAQISTPFNIDEVDPEGARFRRTGHDDVAFVGAVSELVS